MIKTPARLNKETFSSTNNFIASLDASFVEASGSKQATPPFHSLFPNQCQHSASITILTAFITIWSPFTIHDSHASCHPVIHFLILLFVFVPHTWMVRETGLFTVFVWGQKPVCTLTGLGVCMCLCDYRFVCIFVMSGFVVHGLLWVAYGVSLRAVQLSLMMIDDRELEPLPVSAAMHTCVHVCTLHESTHSTAPSTCSDELHLILTCSNFSKLFIPFPFVILLLFQQDNNRGCLFLHCVQQGHETITHRMKTSNQSFIRHASHLTQTCSPECSQPTVSA